MREGEHEEKMLYFKKKTCSYKWQGEVIIRKTRRIKATKKENKNIPEKKAVGSKNDTTETK